MDTGRAPWVAVSVEAASRVRSRSRSSDDARRHARVTRHHARVSPLAPSPSTRDSFIHSRARPDPRRARSHPSSHRVPLRAPTLSRARKHRDARAREFLLHARARSTPRARRRVAPRSRVRARAPRTHPARIDPSRAHTHPRARDGSTSNRHGHAPLVLVSSARVTITARDLRRWCVRGATRARCVAFVVVVAPSVIARAAIVECGRARRKRAREAGARSRDSFVSRVSSIGSSRDSFVSRDRSRGGGGPSVPEAPRSNRSVGRSVGRSVESVDRIDRSVGRGVDGWLEWNGRMTARRSETDRFGMRVGTREVTIGSGTSLEVRMDDARVVRCREDARGGWMTRGRDGRLT